ncbi:TetR/AcrR family transcriptional regulator [Mycolicibacterium grossiae]|uniref:HTH tetR-type domain-containing protein n=1 Tax=Mycolicibacterium grossiae TaxID=1552759 RepID=A0A1E8Q3A4_9MYCO|nr:TetR/AcrR family transcriptional regulator [Mycolicibacterium grossiae]OFJ52906.1 hypothetical protein BEL07_14925 [Mycolicibacterium grossiae]QEM44662.1 TetR/AcrR family transcriptional regulator [Mycolicibacterium grossiae]
MTPSTPPPQRRTGDRRSPVRRRTASDEVSTVLLHAAENVLDRDGTAGVTIRAVAGAAEVAPMSVYNRFGNKDGLLVALATRALDELAKAIATPDGAAPEDRFRRACRAYRRFALAHPARYALIFAAGSPLSDQASPVAQQGRSVFGILVDLIRGIGAPADATESAQAAWSAIHGSISIEGVGIGQTPDADTSFEHLLDLLVAGLTAS